MKTNKAESPLRTCLGCRARRGQSEMTRLALVATENGPAVRWDRERIFGGRGGWLCAGSSKCLARALKKRAFGRAFKVTEPLDLTDLNVTDLNMASRF